MSKQLGWPVLLFCCTTRLFSMDPEYRLPMAKDFTKSVMLIETDLQSMGRLGQTCKDYHQCYRDVLKQGINLRRYPLLLLDEKYDQCTKALCFYADEYEKTEDPLKKAEYKALFSVLWNYSKEKRNEHLTCFYSGIINMRIMKSFNIDIYNDNNAKMAIYNGSYNNYELLKNDLKIHHDHWLANNPIYNPYLFGYGTTAIDYDLNKNKKFKDCFFIEHILRKNKNLIIFKQKDDILYRILYGGLVENLTEEKAILLLDITDNSPSDKEFLGTAFIKVCLLNNKELIKAWLDKGVKPRTYHSDPTYFNTVYDPVIFFIKNKKFLEYAQMIWDDKGYYTPERRLQVLDHVQKYDLSGWDFLFNDKLLPQNIFGKFMIAMRNTNDFSTFLQENWGDALHDQKSHIIARVFKNGDYNFFEPIFDKLIAEPNMYALSEGIEGLLIGELKNKENSKRLDYIKEMIEKLLKKYSNNDIKNGQDIFLHNFIKDIIHFRGGDYKDLCIEILEYFLQKGFTLPLPWKKNIYDNDLQYSYGKHKEIDQTLRTYIPFKRCLLIIHSWRYRIADCAVCLAGLAACVLFIYFHNS